MEVVGVGDGIHHDQLLIRAEYLPAEDARTPGGGVVRLVANNPVLLSSLQGRWGDLDVAAVEFHIARDECELCVVLNLHYKLDIVWKVGKQSFKNSVSYISFEN